MVYFIHLVGQKGTQTVIVGTNSLFQKENKRESQSWIWTSEDVIQVAMIATTIFKSEVRFSYFNFSFYFQALPFTKLSTT